MWKPSPFPIFKHVYDFHLSVLAVHVHFLLADHVQSDAYHVVFVVSFFLLFFLERVARTLP
jgi:hypothetical protein